MNIYRSRNNKKINSQIEVNNIEKFESFINGQAKEPYKKLRIGLSSVGKSGCGIISSYNALLLLGKNPSFSDMLDEFEANHSLVLAGVLGVHIFFIYTYFKKLGYNLKFYILPSKKKLDVVCKLHRANIVLFFHGRGNHYVCVDYMAEKGLYRILNRYSNSTGAMYLNSLKGLSKNNAKSRKIALVLFCIGIENNK